MEERFKYIHFKSGFFYNLLILNPSNYIKLIKIQITVNVSKNCLEQLMLQVESLLLQQAVARMKPPIPT
ncbi:hypothetical protein HpSP79_14100 [Helicobacter pylori]